MILSNLLCALRALCETTGFRFVPRTGVEAVPHETKSWIGAEADPYKTKPCIGTETDPYNPVS